MGAVGQLVNETLAEFLEKANRPGLLGLAGKAAAKKCQKELATYFRGLGATIKEKKFEDLADPDKGMTAETAKHAVSMLMHNLLRNRRPVLSALLKFHLAKAIEQANAIHVFSEADSDEFNQPGSTSEEAAQWASSHVDETIQGLDDTSLQLVADAVGTGIDQHLGIEGTAKLIESLIDTMAGSRAETIASTEMNKAMSWAFLQKLDRNGVEYKQWILGPAPCEDCIENADASPIPVDDLFPSGDDAPPAHPNCVCAVSGARGPQ